MADVNTPPDVAGWVAGGATVADTPLAAPETPVAPPAEVPVEAAPETPPATPETSPADTVVQAMVKGGMTPEDAQKLVESVKTPPAIKDALEAYLDGKPYPVPKNLMFKLKSGTLVQEKSLEALQREGMLATDYQRKTQDVARMRRDLEQSLNQSQARLAAADAREKWIKEREAEMIEAQKDPAKWEQYQEAMRLYQTNPGFKKLYDDALAKREGDAQLDVYRERERADNVTKGVEWARATIDEIAREYPNVDPDRVRTRYAQELALEQTELTPFAIRSIFQSEKDALSKALSPVEQQLTEMRAKIEELTAVRGVESHNAQTSRALERAKAPNTAPAGGGPVAPMKVVPPKPIVGRQAIDDAVSAWSKVRE